MPNECYTVSVHCPTKLREEAISYAKNVVNVELTTIGSAVLHSSLQHKKRLHVIRKAFESRAEFLAILPAFEAAI